MGSNSGCSRSSGTSTVRSMSSPGAAGEAVIDRTRDAMTALRTAEHALLVAIGELAESGAWEATGHRRIGRFLEELWRGGPPHGQRPGGDARRRGPRGGPPRPA